MSVNRINEIIKGKRAITPETAWILAGAFGQTPRFWLNLQVTHDLTKTRPAHPQARLPEVRRSARTRAA